MKFRTVILGMLMVTGVVCTVTAVGISSQKIYAEGENQLIEKS